MASPIKNMASRFGRARRGFDGPAEHAKDSKGTLKRLWDRLKQNQKGLTLVFLLTVLVNALTISPPYLIGRAIDRYINRRIDGVISVDFDGLWFILALIGFLYLANSAASWKQNRVMATVSKASFGLCAKTFSPSCKACLCGFTIRTRGAT